jgi:hypothetical protein
VFRHDIHWCSFLLGTESVHRLDCYQDNNMIETEGSVLKLWIHSIWQDSDLLPMRTHYFTVFCIHTQFLEGHRITDIMDSAGFEFRAL